MRTLVPILGDQLSPALSSLKKADPAATILLMVEVAEEAGYVRHHKAKLAYIFSAMRHHADALRAAGWVVDYVTLDDPDNSGSFTGEVARAMQVTLALRDVHNDLVRARSHARELFGDRGRLVIRKQQLSVASFRIRFTGELFARNHLFPHHTRYGRN